MRFRNRAEAGAQLGERVAEVAGRDAVVLALPRGGVPVGYEVAAALNAPLDDSTFGNPAVPHPRDRRAMGVAPQAFAPGAPGTASPR